MQRIHIVSVLVLLAAAGLVAGCAETAGGKTTKKEPYVSEVLSTGVKKITLTERAAERLDVQVTDVANNVVPYAAVMYGLKGETFVYTNPEPLTYVRADIVVDRVDGDQAFLAQGPPAGTSVVTVGGAELYGIDTGVGK